jgi:L-ribulose-5-phosphate 4-epimerase
VTLEALRAEVCEANRELVRRGLVIEAFGNASGIDREQGRVVIKPSGLACDSLTPDTLVVTDLEGRTVSGDLRPSSDLPTHLALYKAFPRAGGVVHTHSRYATSWAQAGREIPCFGTTHADYFPGSIPVTDALRPEEIASAYEWNTGQAIVRRFDDLDPEELTAVLVLSHGPFCWGASAREAARTAAIVEELARLAFLTVSLDPSAAPIADPLREKHFRRKHGKTAYYGQG